MREKRNEDISYRTEEKDIEDFISYLYGQERAKATIEKYKSDVEAFFLFAGKGREVDKKLLLDYKSWLSSRYAVSSANSKIAALNSFFEFLGLPALKLKNFRIQKKMFLEKELENKEYQDLIRSARSTGRTQLALIMEAICATGIRISELRYLTVENLKRHKVEVANKGKIRVILLPESLEKKLLCYAGKRRILSGPVFITSKGNPKDRSNIWGEMKAVAEEAGVEPQKVFPHNLRHLFARTFYRATRNLAALADILGHSSLEVTRIYTADTLEKFQDTINRLGLVMEFG